MFKKLILGIASVLALAIGGAALDFSANADDVTNGSGKTAATTYHWIDAANLPKDDVRWAQLELRNMGRYNGSLDGVVGPETKRALAGFQRVTALGGRRRSTNKPRTRSLITRARWPRIQLAPKA